MTRVYLNTPNLAGTHSLLIDINPEWIVVEDIADAECIMFTINHPALRYAFLDSCHPEQTLIMLDVFHVHNGMDSDFLLRYGSGKLSHLPNRTVVMHTNMSVPDSFNTLYYDMLFDRQKYYMTEYSEVMSLNNRVWTTKCNKQMYDLHPIIKEPVRKFLAPIRLNPGADTTPSRAILKNLLMEIATDYVYMGGDNKCPLMPAGAAPDQNVSGGWYPISYTYYNSSVVSIYTETIIMKDKVRSITEKTFDPLIQGNFILPFGYCGLISDILKYGFLLPDWIDYSYDTIVDDDMRFSAYLNSVRNLNKYSLQELTSFCQKYYYMLDHNRSVFFTKPYNYVGLTDRLRQHAIK